jgi:uncharacterized DUF497 family protein
MKTTSFVWDGTKAELNLKKHKIPFERQIKTNRNNTGVSYYEKRIRFFKIG